MSGKGFNVATAGDVTKREDEGIKVEVHDAFGDAMTYTETAVPEGKAPAVRPVTITVAGTYSTIYRRALDAQRDRMFKRRRTSLTGDELMQQQIDLVAACVLGWEGFVSGEKPFPFSRENAIVLLRAAPWVREELESAMSDHAGFSPGSGNS